MLSKSLLSFLKESGQQEYLEKVFVKLIPSSDLTVYVLNAHLVIEELVYKLIQGELRDPSALVSANLNYRTKCLLLKGMYGDGFPTWIYEALASLGELRNKCAHVLDHPKLDDAILAVVRAGYEKSVQNEEQLTKNGKGYSLPSSASTEQKRIFEEVAQQQQNISFRLPMACERIIEALLRRWHSKMGNVGDT
ncbi:hypothetical protein [Pseudomonas chlororaphis]|uniref:hypothetical protein n=1 Tax=Pseudomonas chlororaphis TaxID=587753 RepID=UPI000F554905|nr:hypothetical protein [Pseudomonas chlororaphis]AZD50561.1 hypothetical protein C4K20_5170 [Pseudomonas chlororaphis subsp. aurantiaca]